MKILVTGGAGYIGAVTCHELTKAGYQVTVLDCLEHGSKDRIKDLELVVGWTTDYDLVKQVLVGREIEAVIHFAAWIEMGESMARPHKYFHNNVYGSLQLLQAMVDSKVDKLVFSSTAGVYGNPLQIPIKEDDPKIPLNPYGQSKLMVEQLLHFFSDIHKLRSVNIRYFNAAGARLDGSLGEAHQPESHLIPNIIQAVIHNQEFHLFGDDYDTPDGTCIRDYIHVLDLAQTHLIALEALASGHPTDIYNAGIGTGYSNKEVIKMVEEIAGKKVNVKVEPKRPGDASQLISDPQKFQTEFNWQPRYSDLRTIIQTAYSWHCLSA